MKIPAKLCLTRIPYLDMCQEVPETSMIYPTEVLYDFAVEEALDVFITDICKLSIDKPSGLMYKRYVEAGLCDEDQVKVLETNEGYVIEFAPEEVKLDERLAEWEGVWYPKNCIRIVC